MVDQPNRLRRVARTIGRWLNEVPTDELQTEIEGLRHAIGLIRDSQARQRRDFDVAVATHQECLALQKEMKSQLVILDGLIADRRVEMLAELRRNGELGLQGA